MPGESDRDGAVEQPDVDAELEGIRRGDSEQLALDQPSLDLAALGRRIAGPVRRQPLGEVAAEPLAREAVDELRGLAALREADRAQLLLDEPCQQP